MLDEIFLENENPYYIICCFNFHIVLHDMKNEYLCGYTKNLANFQAFFKVISSSTKHLISEECGALQNYIAKILV